MFSFLYKDIYLFILNGHMIFHDNTIKCHFPVNNLLSDLYSLATTSNMTMNTLALLYNIRLFLWFLNNEVLGTKTMHILNFQHFANFSSKRLRPIYINRSKWMRGVFPPCMVPTFSITFKNFLKYGCISF